jgi:hypothetical protein
VELDDRLIRACRSCWAATGLGFMGTYVSPAAQGTGAVAIVGMA